MKSFFLVLLTSFIFCAVNAQVQDFETWKKGRVQELIAEDGWINLIGLEWLNGKNGYLNEFSKDSLALTEKKEKKNIGWFEIRKDSVWFEFNPRLLRKSPTKQSSKQLMYPPLEYGKGGVKYDRWKWTVIQRAGQFAVRMRDLEHAGVKEFQGIPVFDYDSNLRIKAFFEPKFNETMQIPNVLGQVIEWKVMGILKFEIGGKPYQLHALDELGKLFVIFSDETSGMETYPTGRYLYVNYPDKKGMTEIDFNFSYNPPCAFTSFATCPIPPKVNRLPLALKVGEKYPKSH